MSSDFGKERIVKTSIKLTVHGDIVHTDVENWTAVSQNSKSCSTHAWKEWHDMKHAAALRLHASA